MQDLPLFYAPDITTNGLLPEEEAVHAQRVLRLTIGDNIQVTDGKGTAWLAEIEDINKKHCHVRLTEELSYEQYWQGEITLCIAPTKSIDRMEWLLEKAVEIGINRIILLKSKHSERKHINIERLNKIMIGAMKQSQKASLPTLIAHSTFEEALKLTEDSSQLIFHCRDCSTTLKAKVLPHVATIGEDVSLFIGPEGDFTEEEIVLAQQRGATPCTLGASRLRTETAALSALQWVHILQTTRK